jgi:hypothetical protein
MDPGISTFRPHNDSLFAFQGLRLKIVAVVIGSKSFCAYDMDTCPLLQIDFAVNPLLANGF